MGTAGRAASLSRVSRGASLDPLPQLRAGLDDVRGLFGLRTAGAGVLSLPVLRRVHALLRRARRGGGRGRTLSVLAAHTSNGERKGRKGGRRSLSPPPT